MNLRCARNARCRLEGLRRRFVLLNPCLGSGLKWPLNLCTSGVSLRNFSASFVEFVFSSRTWGEIAIWECGVLGTKIAHAKGRGGRWSGLFHLLPRFRGGIWQRAACTEQVLSGGGWCSPAGPRSGLRRDGGRGRVSRFQFPGGRASFRHALCWAPGIWVPPGH